MPHDFINRTTCIEKNYKDNKQYFNHEYKLYKYLQ